MDQRVYKTGSEPGDLLTGSTTASERLEMM